MPAFSAVGLAVAINVLSLTGTAAIIGGTIIGGALAFGTSLLASKLLGPEKPDPLQGRGAANGGRPDTRTTAPPVPVQDARWVLGRARTGGAIVGLFEEGERVFWVVKVLSEGPCDAIEEIWVDDEKIGFNRSGHALAGTGTYNGKITVYEYFDADGTQGAELRSAVGQWTSRHRLEGLSWVAVKLTQPEYGNDTDDRFWVAIPDVQFVMRGAKLTWPGETVPTWTNNAAIIRYWYETERLGVDPDLVDVTSFHAARLLSDSRYELDLPTQLEQYSASGRRYTINGVVVASESVEQTRKDMDFAWQGSATEVGGILHFFPGADRTVSARLTEREIVTVNEVIPAPSIQDRVNSVSLSIDQSRDHDFLEYDVGTITDTPALTRDRQFYRNRDLGNVRFIDDPVRATLLATIGLRQARSSMRVTVTVRPGTGATGPEAFSYMDVVPGHWVTLTLDEYGFQNKLFQVTSRKVNADMTLEWTLEETERGNFADTLVLPPLKDRELTITGRRFVPNVRSFTLDEVARVSGDGTTVVHLVAAWEARAITRTEVRFRPASDTTQVSHVESTASSAELPGVAVGVTYEARARHVNADGIQGDWTEWVQRTVGGDLTPPAMPAGINSVGIRGGYFVGWTRPTEADYGHTEILQASDTTVTVDAISSSNTTLVSAANADSFTKLGIGSTDAIKLFIRHLDRSGNASAYVQTTVTPLSDGSNLLGITDISHTDVAGGVEITITLSNGATDSFTLTDGEDGTSVTVTNIETLPNGDRQITLSGGQTITLPAGQAGRGITSIVRSGDIVTVTYDDSSTNTLPLRDGPGSEAIYRRSASLNARPPQPTTTEDQDATDDFVPAGWDDEPEDVTEALPVRWFSVRKGTTGNWGKFSPVFRHSTLGEKGDRGLEGEDAFGYETVYAVHNYGTELPVSLYPSNDWGFDQPGSLEETEDRSTRKNQWRPPTIRRNAGSNSTSNIVIRYARVNAEPDTPSPGTSTVPNVQVAGSNAGGQWASTAPSGDDQLYFIIGERAIGDTDYYWDDPVAINARHAVRTLYDLSTSLPATPVTGGLKDETWTNPAGWSTTDASSSTQNTYVTIAVAEADVWPQGFMSDRTLRWYDGKNDGLPDPTEETPFRSEAVRRTVGQPAVGQEVPDEWGVPVTIRVHGAPGTAAPRVWTLLSTTNLEVPANNAFHEYDLNPGVDVSQYDLLGIYVFDHRSPRGTIHRDVPGGFIFVQVSTDTRTSAIAARGTVSHDLSVKYSASNLNQIMVNSGGADWLWIDEVWGINNP